MELNFNLTKLMTAMVAGPIQEDCLQGVITVKFENVQEKNILTFVLFARIMRVIVLRITLFWIPARKLGLRRFDIQIIYFEFYDAHRNNRHLNALPTSMQGLPPNSFIAL